MHQIVIVLAVIVKFNDVTVHENKLSFQRDTILYGDTLTRTNSTLCTKRTIATIQARILATV